MCRCSSSWSTGSGNGACQGAYKGTTAAKSRVGVMVFNGAGATQTPLIAQMAMEQNIAASILSASTRSIGDKAYGNMLLGIPGGKQQAAKAIAYLSQMPNILVEEVQPHAE